MYVRINKTQFTTSHHCITLGDMNKLYGTRKQYNYINQGATYTNIGEGGYIIIY